MTCPNRPRMAAHRGSGRSVACGATANRPTRTRMTTRTSGCGCSRRRTRTRNVCRCGDRRRSRPTSPTRRRRYAATHADLGRSILFWTSGRPGSGGQAVPSQRPVRVGGRPSPPRPAIATQTLPRVRTARPPADPASGPARLVQPFRRSGHDPAGPATAHRHPRRPGRRSNNARRHRPASASRGHLRVSVRHRPASNSRRSHRARPHRARAGRCSGRRAPGSIGPATRRVRQPNRRAQTAGTELRRNEPMRAVRLAMRRPGAPRLAAGRPAMR